MLYYRNKRTYKFMREPYATLWPNLVLVIAGISKGLMSKSPNGMYDIKDLYSQLCNYNPSLAYIVAIGEKRISCFYPYPIDLVRKAARESEAWDRYIQEL